MNPHCALLHRVAYLVTLLTLACVGLGDGLQDPRAVSRGIAQAVARGPGTDVRLNELTSFGWRRVYLFGPYTPLKQIRDSVKVVDLHAAADLGRGIESREDINLLVFLFEHHDPESMEHSRSQGDFGPELVGRGYTPREAVFTVREPSRGRWGSIGPHQ